MLNRDFVHTTNSYHIARNFRGVKSSQMDYTIIKVSASKIFEDWLARLCRIWLH